MIGNFHAVLNFNFFSSNSTNSFITIVWFSLFILCTVHFNMFPHTFFWNGEEQWDVDHYHHHVFRCIVFLHHVINKYTNWLTLFVPFSHLCFMEPLWFSETKPSNPERRKTIMHFLGRVKCVASLNLTCMIQGGLTIFPILYNVVHLLCSQGTMWVARLKWAPSTFSIEYWVVPYSKCTQIGIKQCLND